MTGARVWSGFSPSPHAVSSSAKSGFKSPRCVSTSGFTSIARIPAVFADALGLVSAGVVVLARSDGAETAELLAGTRWAAGGVTGFCALLQAMEIRASEMAHTLANKRVCTAGPLLTVVE